MKKLDLTNRVFGRLTAISPVNGTGNRKRGWLCICVCGNQTTVMTYLLTSSNTRSCGCLLSEVIKQPRRHGHSAFDSAKKSITYKSWSGLKQRCENPKNSAYAQYGGRGIKLCASWHDFRNFLADMGERPSVHHSLDRFPNNDGNYEPGNCRWATDTEQAGNKRNNRYLTHNGETKPLTAWARDLGIRHATLRERLDAGWPLEKALAPGKHDKTMLAYDGMTMSIRDWAKRLEMTESTLSARRQRGFPIEMILHKGRFKSGSGSPRL